MCTKQSIICIILAIISITCSQVRGRVCTDGGSVHLATDASASALDSNGHIFVVGSIDDYTYKTRNNYTITIAGKVFGGGDGDTPVSNTGYIAKLTTNSNTATWVKYIGLVHPAQQPMATIDSIAIYNNKIYISGQISGSIDVFGCPLSTATEYDWGVYVASLDETGTCTGSMLLNGSSFTTNLQVDNATGQLYLYASSVYGSVTFGDYTFTSVSDWAMYVVRITAFEVDWVEQIENIKGGETQDLFAAEDFTMDGTKIYAVVEGSGYLKFCDKLMSCTERNFTGMERVLIGLSKTTGAVTTTSLELHLKEFNVLSVAARVLVGGTQFYVGELGEEVLISNYNIHGNLLWATLIPNNYTKNFRQLESYSVGIRVDATGVYVGGSTDTGSGADFVTDQPWIAKLDYTGALIFNTRANIDIHSPPDRFSYASNIALGGGQAFLVGAFGCTLEFGDFQLVSSGRSCSYGEPNGRNTEMYVVSVDSTTGAGC